LFNFEEERSLAMVTSLVSKINDIKTKCDIADEIAMRMTILRRDYFGQLGYAMS
jgi:hypothetical protein